MTLQQRNVLLTALSAALYVAAFPPLAWAPLAWLAPAPLVIALADGASARNAGALGALWSALCTLGVAGWLPRMVASFFDLGPWASWLYFAAVIVIGVAPFYAAFGIWVWWFTRRRRMHPALAGLAWMTVEWARANLGIDNPWAQLAHSQADSPTLLQIADLGGVLVLSGLVFTAGTAASGLIDRRFRMNHRRASAALFAGALSLVWVYGAVALRREFATGPRVQVGLVQSGLPREERFRAESQHDNLERQLRLTSEAARAGASLVLWPEFAVGFPLRDPSALRDRLVGASRELGIELGLGAPDYLIEDGVPHLRNSFFLVSDGSVTDRHDKVRLMPFSEENPFARSPRTGGYVAGEPPKPLEVRSGRLGILLCSEAMHPSHVREVVASGATILANPSVDDWFGSRSAAAQQLAAARFRAVEERRYVLRPTTTGYTALIDAHGRIVRSLPFGSPGVLVGEVRPSYERTIYSRLGDLPVLLGAMVVLLSTVARSR